ncbi:LAO/AO transport system ATPase [Nitrospira sp. KM1]|uniref:methylmalonyl Co-A mutase-associated GTPase MeaB n=1 Tax=Nitrospira sp. KM1 TaxID=1936990 RepID=UPI0013A7249B|nr:methylmalonyl Co-A mutase-associated GTPase MeaB [Nitrospira sp. KM1]BCA53350.1 LAO/AO transport system ATPase [Nitrospira sp. KM1]
MTRIAPPMTREINRPLVLAGQVKARNVRAISRLITLLEIQHPDGTAALRVLNSSANAATVIGVTGYPGSGKSTLIDRLVTAYRRLGMKVGVLAVDISSHITGGALLGDRIRMQDHVPDWGVYIRSMATRGYAGGLARATGDAVVVLKAAGYEVILIETIGVGQNEVGVMTVAQTVLAVIAPGLGDEVQAMKAGLLEMAHIVVVNKGDHPGADSTLRDLRGCFKAVLRTVATTGEGVTDLLSAIAEHQRVRFPQSAETDEEMNR